MNAIVYPRLTEPQPGQHLDVEWGREVVQAIKSITPISGKNVDIHRTSSGTILRASGDGKRVSQTVGGSGVEPIPCRVTGGDAINGYNVDLYENGITLQKTGEGTLFVMQFSNVTYIPEGTVVLAWPKALNIVGGTEQGQ